MNMNIMIKATRDKNTRLIRTVTNLRDERKGTSYLEFEAEYPNERKFADYLRKSYGYTNPLKWRKLVNGKIATYFMTYDCFLENVYAY